MIQRFLHSRGFISALPAMAAGAILYYMFPFPSDQIFLRVIAEEDWKGIEPRLRSSVVEGISVFLSLFDDNPKVKRVFCPKKECYDPAKNMANSYGKPLPSFSWLIEHGKVCALNFPASMNPGLARALGVIMKLDFERAVLSRIPDIEAQPERHFRQVLFLCDEYHHFATVGENDPTGDEKFFSLSRQPKCIPIIATQSISSLRSALPGETWRTLLQTFRTKILQTVEGVPLGSTRRTTLGERLQKRKLTCNKVLALPKRTIHTGGRTRTGRRSEGTAMSGGALSGPDHGTTAPAEDRPLTVREAAKYLGVSPSDCWM
jgi:hypothetical protein